MIWDVVIIGAGPAGLSAALFTRMRRMSTLLLETAVAGGQLASLYPKKPVHDMPSYTYVMGEDLGKNFVDQARHMGAEIHEGEHVTMIARDDAADLIRITSTKGTYEARSALIHMLDKWQGMDGYVEDVLASPIRAILETETVEIRGDGKVESVVVRSKKTGETEDLPIDIVSINIGYLMDTKIVRQWGLTLSGTQIQVDNVMNTNIPGVFCCGDIATYPGKYKLLITACSEGAAAGNTAYVHVKKPKKFTVGELYAAPKEEGDTQPKPA